MTKRIIRFSLFLASVIGGILFIQWKGYTSEKDGALLNAEQTVTVRHTHGEMTIKQVIRNLPEGKYHVIFPQGAKEPECHYKDGKPCKWAGENKGKVKIKENPVTFSYKLNMPPNASSYLLENWGLKIEEAPNMDTRIQLTEQSWRNGSWAAGAELAGKEKMEALDYYVYESDVGLPPLYWQNKDLIPREVNNNLIIYENVNAPLNTAVLEKIVPNDKRFVIIGGSAKNPDKKGRLIIFPGGGNVEKSLTRHLAREKLSFDKEEEWLVELIVSLLAGKPAENDKVEKMRKTVVSLLTEEQLDRWLDNVLSDDSGLTSVKLDELLKDTANIKTDFFQKNAVNTQPFQPFYYMDNRDVYIGGKRSDKVKILLQNEQAYISLLPLIEGLGYNILDNPNSSEMKIEKDGDIYHFNFNQKLFSLNGKQYGFKKNPFIVSQNEVYLDTAALAGIFGLEMTENESQISIQ